MQHDLDCQAICPALGISSSFFSVLKACQLYLHGKDDKAEKLCRNAMKELSEVELHDAEYELTSVVQAFIQESIQWTSQNKKIMLFERIPEEVLNIVFYVIIDCILA